MFSDSYTTCTGFSSCCELKRESENVSAQTSAVDTNSKEVQAREHLTVGIQTETVDFCRKAVDYDEEKLAAFLGRICPAVVKELDRVSRSNAFASYSLSTTLEEEVRPVAVLRPEKGEREGTKVSELSWSCTGSVLAVASTHSLHTSWCSHQGHVQLYNVDSDSKNASRTLEATSCVRSVSMHPYLSSVVAAGTTFGEVMVWDVVRESSDAALVNSTCTTHSDAVTRVLWVLGPGTAVMLVSAALDGYLYLWRVSPQLGIYQVSEKYKCDMSGAEPGITSFAFPHHQQDKFVVALEGGSLLHCSIVAARPVASVTGFETIKDPIVSCFEPLPATVTHVEFSPHHDEVFATISTDHAIRTFSLYQGCVQQVIWGVAGLVGLAWNPHQANVLAGWGHLDSVFLYNSQSGEMLGSLTAGEKMTNLSALAFNIKSTHLLAVGDLESCIQIWKIPTQFPTKAKHL